MIKFLLMLLNFVLSLESEVKTIEKPAVTKKIGAYPRKHDFKKNTYSPKPEKLSPNYVNTEGKSHAKSHVLTFDPKKLAKNYDKTEDPQVRGKFEKIYRNSELSRNQVKNTTFKERSKSLLSNVVNIAKNAFDNTGGYLIAKGQNYQTARALKKNPNQDIAYIDNGIIQNIGPGWRRAASLKKHGMLPYHLKTFHNKPIEEAYDKTVKQVEKLHKKTKLKDVSKRNDAIQGHSSGGNMVIYASQQKKTADLGIKHGQAIASIPYGMPLETPENKFLGKIFNLKDDVITSKEGRAKVVKSNQRKPYISIETVSGKYDGLVPLKDSIYEYSNKHHILTDRDSTHFGTSGSNSKINDQLTRLLVEQKNKYVADSVIKPTKIKDSYVNDSYLKAA